MSRTLCFLVGLILAAGPPLWDRFGSGSQLSADLLAQASGGDPIYQQRPFSCDQYVTHAADPSSAYVGCATEDSGKTCKRCSTVNADNTDNTLTSYSSLVQLTVPVSPGKEFKPEQPRQKCGNVYMGVCMLDPNESGQYV